MAAIFALEQVIDVVSRNVSKSQQIFILAQAAFSG
jgi:hypothetical protein